MNKSISYFLPILTYTFYSIFLYYPHNLHQVIICSKQVTNETFESKLNRESCAISGIKPISIWYKKRFYSAVNHSAGCFDCVNATEIINYQRDMSPLRYTGGLGAELRAPYTLRPCSASIRQSPLEYHMTWKLKHKRSFVL